MNVSDYVNGNWISWRNGSTDQDIKLERAPYLELPWSGFMDWARFISCFALKVPDSVVRKNIQSFGIKLSYNIFPSGKRPLIHGLDTFIHYPKQLLRSLETHKYAWNPSNENSELTMRFKTNNMEIIRQRNKRSQPCNENWKDDDDEILIKHTESFGCRPPYMSPSNKIKKCNTREKLAEWKFTISSSGYKSYPPCKSVGKVTYFFEESDRSNTSSSWKTDHGQFWIGIWLGGQQFKEIQKRR